MTPAEYRTVRAGLGLSAQQVANIAGVQLRTVQRWEKGQDRPRTGDVAVLLSQFDSKINTTVARMVASADRLPADSNPVLVRYTRGEDIPRPTLDLVPDMPDVVLTLHCALVERTREALAIAGRRCRIVWFDAAAYLDWLAGRDDRVKLREQWAISTIEGEAV